MKDVAPVEGSIDLKEFESYYDRIERSDLTVNAYNMHEFESYYDRIESFVEE